MLRAFLALTVFLLSAMFPADALTIDNKYRSPRNKERPIRKSTRLIVLHTTEAHAKSSLNKLSERGEAHYCIPENGKIYRIVDREREAFHAGRSMWNGREDCDKHSIGIEVVGYHNKPVTLKQIEAIKELVASLQSIYNLKDHHVVCHSHVAYGAPNKWQKKRHRGRKRCGMLFAMASLRTRLGLATRPAYDPDVKAKRLVQADDYLEKILYGSVDTMASHYGRGKRVTAIAVTPKAKAKPKPVVKIEPKAVIKAAPEKVVSKSMKDKAKFVPARGKVKDKVNDEEKKSSLKPGCRTIGVEGKTYHYLGGADPYSKDVIFVKPNGEYGTGDKLTKESAAKLPNGTRVMIGYQMGGPVGPKKGAMSICGAAWKKPTTYYLSGSKFISGDKINERQIQAGTMIFWLK